MRKTLLAISLIASPLFAASSPTEVALKFTGMTARTNKMTPLLVSDTTRGGATHNAEEYVWSHYSDVLATEICDDYVAENKAAHHVEDAPMPVSDMRQFESGNGIDWDRLHEKFPKVNGVVILSEPAYDSLKTVAVMRYDILSPKRSIAGFITAERKPVDGSWSFVRATVGSRESVYRTDDHMGHPPERCPVPADKRHSEEQRAESKEQR